MPKFWIGRQRPLGHAKRRPRAALSYSKAIDFAWQEGYAAFSVSASQLSAVREYIQNQAAHHQRRNFEEEFIALLKKSAVAYDPKYVLG